MAELINFLKINDIEFKSEYDLKKLTKENSKVVLKIYCTPNKLETYEGLLKYCLENNLKFEVVGQMWNTYFKDSFDCDILISTIRLNKFIEKDNQLICEPGCTLPKVSKWAMKNLIKDYEGFSGIPGTVAGSAICNSGAFNSSISNVLISLVAITEDQKKIEISNSDLEYKTRESNIKNGKLKVYILQVTLDISNKDIKENIDFKYKSYQWLRKNTIDGKNNSLGSVFISSTLKPIFIRYRFIFILKSIVFRVLKIFISESQILNKLNTKLIFLFLGNADMADHCDSFNRFVWKENTTEDDFFKYIKFMSYLSKNQAVLEILIKE